MDRKFFVSDIMAGIAVSIVIGAAGATLLRGDWLGSSWLVICGVAGYSAGMIITARRFGRSP